MYARVTPASHDATGSIAIEPSPSGRGFRLDASQFLPCDREQIFEFFADAFQLETLTPSFLRFKVLTEPPIDLAAGTLIDYRLRIRGLPIHWQSCISVWEPPQRFVDEQIRGPYRRWHHEHSFESCDGGTLCRDVVDYEVYGGALVHWLIVRGDLLKIFHFRHRKLRELFPALDV
ncbi:MAG: CDP-paratose 2-epimerase [Planctomycetota bacterium]|nr:MAG: CDP-paratose 2-epimerase [Planctomycetota bacterium]